MALRPELAPGRFDARPTHDAHRPSGSAPVWGDAVTVQLPDPELAHAVDVARRAVAGREVLQPRALANGTARLAQRLALRDPEDERLDKILGVLRASLHDGLVTDRSGRPDHDATALLGRCEGAQRDPRAWDRAHALASHLAGAPTVEGTPDASAALLAVVGSLLASASHGELAILPILPDAWFGEDVEVRGLPVAGGGRVSWSLTWPDDWPALRWASSVPGHRITSPGVAPGWADERPRGEMGPGPRL